MQKRAIPRSLSSEWFSEGKVTLIPGVSTWGVETPGISVRFLGDRNFLRYSILREGKIL